MRILIVSYFFPPYNTIGAVRLGKIAKYLTAFGHEVRVVTAEPQSAQATLPLEIPAENVTYTRWLDVNLPVTLAMGGRNRTAAKGYGYTGPASGVVGRLGALYKTFFHFPDGMIGWLPYAERGVTRVLREWRPDVVYASALPFTSLLAAHRACSRAGVPWVAEFRDLWTDSPVYGHTGARRRADERMERWALSSVAGFATVSDPMARTLERKYDRPAAVILNGYDPDDIPAAAVVPTDGGRVNIVHSGMVYPGMRDPAPLFAAMAQLGPAVAKVRVRFFGRYLGGLLEMARQRGVEEQVEVHDQVPYAESLRLQRTSDVLLLLTWPVPQADGDYSGKVFEYIGAGRPVLALGRPENVALRLVEERRAGFSALDAGRIAAQLRAWIDEKAANGTIAAPPPDAAEGLSRQAQVRKLESFLEGIVAGTARVQLARGGG